MTSRFFGIVIVAAVIVGCGSTSTTSDLPALTTQLAEELKTVKDEASATAARPKLQALVAQIRAIQVQVKEGKAAMPADVEAFGRRQEKAMKAYTEQVSRISEIPAAAKQLQGTITEFQR